MSVIKVESAVNAEIQCDVGYVFVGRIFTVVSRWSGDGRMENKSLSNASLWGQWPWRKDKLGTKYLQEK